MANKPLWAERIERERKARSWTQQQAITMLRMLSDRSLPSDDSMLRSWKSWEAGKHRPNEQYQRLIAKLFGTVTLAIFSSHTVDDHFESISTEETLEILERIKRSDINDATLHSLEIKVEELCCQYSYADTNLLIQEAANWIQHLNGLLSARVTFGQHAKILELTGWLTLLLGCLSWDNLDLRAAESARRTGLKIGKEVSNVRIQSWAHEMTGWFSLSQRNWQRALPASQLGQQIAGNNDIAAQIASQEAEAWARLNEMSKAQEALGKALQILEALPAPNNPHNHFVVDHDKFDKVAMKLACLTGMDEQALSLADELKRKFTAKDGSYTKPMRVAEAINSTAIVYARNGNIDEAIRLGHEALDIKRQSIPSLTQDANDLMAAISLHAPNNKLLEDYQHRVQLITSATQALR